MIKKIVRAVKTRDGAGVKLTRVIGHSDVYDFDPFLMLDAFDSENPDDYIRGFPFHPHRGIETITYLIKGDIDHKDSLGNSGKIRDLESQWMTAGSGIIHQEMPQPAEHMLGVQLWLNLPKKDKMTDPKYNDITGDSIAIVKENDYTVRVISGSYGGAKAKFEGDYVKMQFIDIDLKANKTFDMNLKEENNSFVYIVQGELIFPECDLTYESGGIPEKSAVLLGDKKLHVTAGSDGARFLLFSAKPLKEPIAWGGPIVMNSDEELNHAFDELEEGTFIKHK